MLKYVHISIRIDMMQLWCTCCCKYQWRSWNETNVIQKNWANFSRFCDEYWADFRRDRIAFRDLFWFVMKIYYTSNFAKWPTSCFIAFLLLFQVVVSDLQIETSYCIRAIVQKDVCVNNVPSIIRSSSFLTWEMVLLFFKSNQKYTRSTWRWLWNTKLTKCEYLCMGEFVPPKYIISCRAMR